MTPASPISTAIGTSPDLASYGLTAPRNGAGAATIDVFGLQGGAATVTWSPGIGSGVEGGAIALGTIAASGSGLTALRVSGIPVGATLSDGTHSFVASAGNGSVDVLGWSYTTLSIKPVNDANFALTVQASDALGAVSGTANVAVTVAPLAPSVAPAAVSGVAGQAIPLSLGITANGLAGDSNSLRSVTLSGIPGGATLSNSRGDPLTVSGGSITFSPGQLAAGVLNGLAITPLSAGSFVLGVSAVEQDGEGNLSAPATSADGDGDRYGGRRHHHQHQRDRTPSCSARRATRYSSATPGR